MPVLIGTSGWQYADSQADSFYPKGLARGERWLEHYAERFRT